ncbi:Uncharacterised protein [Mycobacteroides abscessus subsp. abscessus]|nr:Uncharacterised protein [Mycobacteroides abscessus subsp. abscessus]
MRKVYCSSSDLAWPSIHPKHNASSRASLWLRLAMPLAFLAILIQTPGESSWFCSSHASQSRWEAK